MDKDFIDLIKKIVGEKGKDILKDSRLAKGVFLDYAKGQYKHEINLLVKVLELKFFNKIMDSDDLNFTRMILSKKLQEELFIVDKIAFSIVEMLIGLLRDSNFLKYSTGYKDTVNQYDKRPKTISNNIQDDFTPSHKVKLLTNVMGLGLRKEPNPSLDSFIRLPEGTEIQHLAIGGPIKLLKREGLWFKIRTRDGIFGWCFSGSLEKI